MKTEDYFNKIIDKNLIDGSWLFLGIDEDSKFKFVLERAGNMREKQKMLVTSIFSFSHSVFYPSYNKLQFFSHVYYVV
jgi:hypothetical protein